MKELIEAVKNNKLQEVMRILNSGADANLMIEDATPLDLKAPIPLIGFAVAAGFKDIVEFLLKSKADVNKVSASGASPFYLSCLFNSSVHYEISEVLVRAGADIHKQHSIGRTPLAACALNGDLKRIRYLVSLGAKSDCELAEKNGFTPIMSACEKGHLEVVKFFLEEMKVPLEAKTKAGWTALGIACCNGQLKAAQYLISMKANTLHTTNEGKTLLMGAAEEGHVNILKYLVEELRMKVDDINYKGRTALGMASVAGNLNAVQYLLEQKANLDHEEDEKRTLLMLACEVGHVEIINLLLNAGVNVNKMTSPKGSTALRIAVVNKKAAAVARLIQHPSIDVNLRLEDTRYMWSPLNAAVDDNNIDIVKLLLTVPAIDINQHDHFYNNPLLTAAKKGFTEIVKSLLAHPNINVNIRTLDGKSPLSLATDGEFDEIVMLLSNRPDIELDEEIPLINAVSKGNIHDLDKLLSVPDTDVNETNSAGESALFIACQKNKPEIVKQLLKVPTINVNLSLATDMSPLYLAAEKGFAACVEELIKDPRIDINIRYEGSGAETALGVASRLGHTQIVKLLLNVKGTKVNQARASRGNDGFAPLNFAARKGHIEIVRMLAEHPDIDINIRTAEWTGSFTPLIDAANHGHSDCVHILLKHPKIDVNARTSGGYTALAQAAVKGSQDSITALLGHPDVDVNLASHEGYTPLICALDHSHESIIARLAKHPKIKIDLADKDGDTALIYAARKGNLNIVKILAENGASISNKSMFKSKLMTPFEQAVEKGHTEVADYLKMLESKMQEKQKSTFSFADNKNSSILFASGKHSAISDKSQESDTHQNVPSAP